MDLIRFLKEVQKYPCVSGREYRLAEKIRETCSPDYDESFVDAAGNCVLIRNAKKKGAPVVLLEAHLDEIGLCIKEILDGGFVSVEACGGFDASLLPGTEFILYGKKLCRAVVAQKPPHLLQESERKEKPKIGNIYLDTGFETKEETEKYLSVGDVAHYAAEPEKLAGGVIASRGLDNKASVYAVLEAAKKASADACTLIVLLSAGEETTGLGVSAFCRKYRPDLAIVVDVGFGYSEGLDPTHCIRVNEGPSVSVTDTLSRRLSFWAIGKAKEKGLPCQTVCEPGGTGTDATPIQVMNGGIPSVVVSIPLKNMHTQSELVTTRDLEDTVRLLAALCQEPDFDFREVDHLGKA